MKFSIAAFLLGAASAAEITDPIAKEAQLLETECQDYQNYDEENLMQLDEPEELEDVAIDESEERHIKGTET